MKKQIIGVLIYLLVVKSIDLLMKSVVDLQLEKFGLKKKARQCIRLSVEILAILTGLYLLKARGVFKIK